MRQLHTSVSFPLSFLPPVSLSNHASSGSLSVSRSLVQLHKPNWELGLKNYGVSSGPIQRFHTNVTAGDGDQEQ